jgi:hypothetical protein
MIRLITAYKLREGVLPNAIEIHRYNPETGVVVKVERFGVNKFLPGGE